MHTVDWIVWGVGMDFMTFISNHVICDKSIKTQDMRNYYEIIGVHQNASTEQVYIFVELLLYMYIYILF